MRNSAGPQPLHTELVCAPIPPTLLGQLRLEQLDDFCDELIQDRLYFKARLDELERTVRQQQRLIRQLAGSQNKKRRRSN